MNRRRIKPTAMGVAAAAVMLLAAQAAFAADEVTRESYTAQVEPICKASTESNGRTLKGVQGEIKNGKLKPAAAQFTKAAAALKKTLNQLRAVPQPPADKAKLTKWLGYIKEEVSLFERTAAKLKAGQKNGALEMAVRLKATINQANNQVLAFEFNYCHAEYSQFT
jgi:hypothetical protein